MPNDEINTHQRPKAMSHIDTLKVDFFAGLTPDIAEQAGIFADAAIKYAKIADSIATEADTRIATLEREKAELVGEIVIAMERVIAHDVYPAAAATWRNLVGLPSAVYAANRLVTLNAWEQHPTKPGLYRPVATPNRPNGQGE